MVVKEQPAGGRGRAFIESSHSGRFKFGKTLRHANRDVNNQSNIRCETGCII
jgi:hypothetical protein